MNLIQTTLGGFALYLDDVEYLQNNTKTMLEALLSPYTSQRPNFIFSGCEMTVSFGQPIVVTAGFVVVGGELLKFDGGSISPSDQEAKIGFVLEETDDPTGQRELADSTPFNAYKTRRAILAELSTVDNEVDSWLSFELPKQHLWRFMEIVNGKQLNLVLDNGWGGALGSNGSVKYRKDLQNQVFVSGQTASGYATPSTNIVGTLPNGYRPTSQQYGSFCTNNKVYSAFITTSGLIVVAFDGDSLVDGQFMFDGFLT